MTLKFISAAFNNNPVDATKAFDAHMQERLHQYVDGATKSVAEDLFSSEVDEENLDELSNKTLTRYRDAADKEASGLRRAARYNGGHEDKATVLRKSALSAKAEKRERGIDHADAKLGSWQRQKVEAVNQMIKIINNREAGHRAVLRSGKTDEEVIDEGSILDQPPNAATGPHWKKIYAAHHEYLGGKITEKEYKKRVADAKDAMSKTMREEVLDEISDKLKKRYTGKAEKDITKRFKDNDKMVHVDRTLGKMQGNRTSDVVRDAIYAARGMLGLQNDKNFGKIQRRRKGIRRASDFAGHDESYVDNGTEIAELSKETIGRYEVANLKDQIKTSNHANGNPDNDARSKDYKRIIKREAGHRAVLRGGKANEEVIDEISKGLAGRYINKASGDMHRIGQDVHQQRRDLRDLHDIEFGGYGVPYKDRISARDGRKEVESDVRKSNRRGSNHAAGIGRAVKRIQKEDVIDEDNLNELSKGTLGRYIDRSVSDVNNRTERSGRLAQEIARTRDAEVRSHSRRTYGEAPRKVYGRNLDAIAKRQHGIHSAVSRLQKEDVIDEVQAPNARPDRAMAALNPIEKHQLFAAPNSMFDPDMKQAPKRLADASRLPTADQAKADKMERDVAAVRPTQKAAGGMSADWKANVKGADTSNALPDDEDRNYPIFSMVGGTNV